ncbi:MAG: acyl carrier protein [Clostridia bacterium]|nr:acyl carrier protein [Clostridia bacterium]
MTVLERVRDYLCERCGCFYEDVELAASFDELNVADFEREALALLLTEAYEVEIPSEELFGFETLEDLVGYVEDRF